MKKILVLFVLAILPIVSAEEQKTVCSVYFTGVGCPNCAKTDPILFGDTILKYNQSLVVIEYEIYQQMINAGVLLDYGSVFDMGYGVPKLIIGTEEHLDGGRDILNNLDDRINQKIGLGTKCMLLDSAVRFEELDLNTLPGKPNIWFGDRVLFKVDDNSNVSSALLRELLFTENISGESKDYPAVEARDIAISGGSIRFNKAIELDGWILQWNEKDNDVDRMQYSFEHYMEWIPYMVLAFGGLMLILIHLSEKKKQEKGGAG